MFIFNGFFDFIAQFLWMIINIVQNLETVPDVPLECRKYTLKIISWKLLGFILCARRSFSCAIKEEINAIVEIGKSFPWFIMAS